MINQKKSGKLAEGFVQWKEPPTGERQVGVSQKDSLNGGIATNGRIVNSHCRSSGVEELSSGICASSVHQEKTKDFIPPVSFSEEDSVDGRDSNLTTRAVKRFISASTYRNEDVGTRCPSMERNDSPLRNQARRRSPTVPAIHVRRSHGPCTPNAQSHEMTTERQCRGKVRWENRGGDVITAEVTPGRITSTRGKGPEVEEGTQEYVYAADEEADFEEADYADRAYGVQTSQGRRSSGHATLSYTDNVAYNESDGEEDNRRNSDGDEEVRGWYEVALQEVLMDDNKSRKRRERRQAQAAREREGQRRRKEGKKRNFLLVDEHSMKPYGVGVGDWRKELMLLSQNLDPAIGNINQQPEGAVVEIAEWIQETWEYSSPIKFAVVKEVVARGVTLRRAELWKMIRNNEKKPDKISDRSWKILQRQLESPATVKKSENCSRANASRVNFGRTGPSGEVGVRERLRRRLRRSPDPEEIRFEMARDKGYGGRWAALKRKRNVREGIEDDGRLLTSTAQVMRKQTCAEVREESSEEQMERGVPEDVLGNSNAELNLYSSGNREGERVSSEGIAGHPLVQSLLQRLEALESHQMEAAMAGGGLGAPPTMDVEVAIVTGGQENDKVEVAGSVDHVGGAATSRRPGRPRKKKQQS